MYMVPLDIFGVEASFSWFLFLNILVALRFLDFLEPMPMIFLLIRVVVNERSYQHWFLKAIGGEDQIL